MKRILNDDTTRSKVLVSGFLQGEKEEKSMKEIVDNLKKCPSYDRCSQNLCPLDLELNIRFGLKSERCRYMREQKVSKINGKEFMSGGSAMPDDVLVFVPKENHNWLNQASRKRHKELMQNNGKFTHKSHIQYDLLADTSPAGLRKNATSTNYPKSHIQ